MADAYQRLSKVAGGHDPDVPIALSTLTRILDCQMMPGDRERIIKFYEEYLVAFPNGLNGLKDGQ